MKTYVALLRGINVGGKNIVPMQRFRDLLGELGCRQVATYIQSGNAVFTHAGTAKALATTIADAIDGEFGFKPVVVVLDATAFAQIVAANPFACDKTDPKCLHVSFLKKPATAVRQDLLQKLAAPTEDYVLTEAAFYLRAPEGIGRSKLAAKVEQCLGVEATARNWRTTGKIDEMLRKLA